MSWASRFLAAPPKSQKMIPPWKQGQHKPLLATVTNLRTAKPTGQTPFKEHLFSLLSFTQPPWGQGTQAFPSLPVRPLFFSADMAPGSLSWGGHPNTTESVLHPGGCPVPPINDCSERSASVAQGPAQWLHRDDMPQPAHALLQALIAAC